MRRSGEFQRLPTARRPTRCRSAAVTSWPSGSSSADSVTACCRASRSVGASSADWAPASATKVMASAASAVLPEPTSPWTSRIIGRPDPRSARICDRGDAGRP